MNHQLEQPVVSADAPDPKPPRVVIVGGGPMTAATCVAINRALATSATNAEIVLTSDDLLNRGRISLTDPLSDLASLSRGLASSFYDSPPFPKKRVAPVVKEITERDRARMAAAQAKRDRKARRHRTDEAPRVAGEI